MGQSVRIYMPDGQYAGAVTTDVLRSRGYRRTPEEREARQVWRRESDGAEVLCGNRSEDEAMTVFHMSCGSCGARYQEVAADRPRTCGGCGGGQRLDAMPELLDPQVGDVPVSRAPSLAERRLATAVLQALDGFRALEGVCIGPAEARRRFAGEMTCELQRVLEELGLGTNTDGHLDPFAQVGR